MCLFFLPPLTPPPFMSDCEMEEVGGVVVVAVHEGAQVPKRLQCCSMRLTLKLETTFHTPHEACLLVHRQTQSERVRETHKPTKKNYYIFSSSFLLRCLWQRASCNFKLNRGVNCRVDLRLLRGKVFKWRGRGEGMGVNSTLSTSALPTDNRISCYVLSNILCSLFLVNYFN